MRTFSTLPRHRRPRFLAGTVAALALAAAPFLVSAPAHAAGTAHYLNCSAASNGDGSSASPWNSLASANAGTLNAGDSLLLARGSVCTGQLAPRGSGTSGTPITVDAYGSGNRPIVNGAGLAESAFLLNNQQYWEVHNLELTDTGTTSADRSGLIVNLTDFGTGHHYLVDNVYVHDVNGLDSQTKVSNGITFRVAGTATPTHFDDVTVQNSEVANVTREGLVTQSSWNCRSIYGTGCTAGQTWTGNTNVTFKNNYIHDIWGDGIVLRVGINSVVTGNKVYHANAGSAYNNAGLWTIDSDGTVISHNEVYGTPRRAGQNDGMAFDSDFGNQNVVIEYNYSHDNAGGFLLFCGGCGSGSSTTGTIVRYNLSRSDGSRILYAVGEKSAQIYGNTVYLPSGSTTPIIQEDTGNITHTVWTDNILDNQGTGGYAGSAYTPANYTWSGNLFYGYHPANEPADAGKLTSDPQLANPGSGTTAADFQLGAASPARASGTVVGANGGLDYFGSAVPQVCAPDRGFQQASAFNDSTCSAPNPIGNPGFETGTASPWTMSANVSVETAHPHSGTHDAKLGPLGSAEQKITVVPGATYTLSGWGEVAAAGQQVVIGVKNYGGSELRAPAFTGTTYAQGSVSFTAGASNTLATIYCYNRLSTAGTGYCDDLSVVRTG
jgi:hypothetical protein